MAKYLDLFLQESALADPMVVLDETHLAAADIFVDLALRERGIDPDDVTLPNAVLSEIALYWAKRAACVAGSISDDSPLIDKAKQYENSAQTLVNMLSRAALGLNAPTGSAFAQVSLGRG